MHVIPTEVKGVAGISKLQRYTRKRRCDVLPQSLKTLQRCALCIDFDTWRQKVTVPFTQDRY